MTARAWTAVLDHGHNPSSFQVRCGLCSWRSRWHRRLADAHAERRAHFAVAHAQGGEAA